MKNIFTFALLAAFFSFFASFAVFTSGCSNYKLAGTARPLPFSSIYVQPVKNSSTAPQASSLLTNALISELSQVPNVSVESADDADAILEINLSDYSTKMRASRSSDTALAASYIVELTATCTLRNLRTGDVIFRDRKVSVNNTVYSLDGNNSFVDSQYQNMPILTRELALRIKDTVIGVW